MVLMQTPEPVLGQPATDFDLPGVDGQQHSLASTAGRNGLLVMFICNHCPYVKAIRERLLADCAALLELGVGVVAISSNDASAYPADSFPRMRELAQEWGMPFPYCYDASQQVARAYGAVCTPDFFLYTADLRLYYRGRLDGAGLKPRPDDMPADLLLAARGMCSGEPTPQPQHASMGCSIKWLPSPS